MVTYPQRTTTFLTSCSRNMATIRPMPGWVLCRTLPESAQSSGGIVLPVNVDENVTTEGVAQVVEITPKKGHPPPVEVGSYIVYRGFLRFCNQMGDQFDSSRSCEYFLLNLDDALAEVEGPGRIGAYGEYELE